MEELEAILERARTALSEDDHKKLEAAVKTLAFLTHTLEDKRTTITRLRKLLFGPKTEKTATVFPDQGEKQAPDVAAGEGRVEDSARKPPKGHGRNSAASYRAAEKIEVPYESFKPKDPCPECRKGKVYELAEPRHLVRITGQAPVKATVYQLQRLRCNLCGKIFTAEPPEGVGREKYDARSASMIALLKYGTGLPFNRLARLEENLGIPLPASTQWEIAESHAAPMVPAYRELIHQAAQGEVLYNDDTRMKILEWTGKRGERNASAESSGRKGSFTTGIVSTAQGRRIALFFTGRRHAGENLEMVLKERARELALPIQMCDGLSRNTSGDFKTILGNCNAHARRQFADVAENFAADCRRVLETFGEVYKNDSLAAEKGFSAEERLRFHRAESRPLMIQLRLWFRNQIRDRKIEPNSGLGQAIAYMRKHWMKLTLFYRKPGAPLDNSICERALKKAILNRKNSYFYRTDKGARVGDLYMSLIHTCELEGTNPFEYLTALQENAAAVKEHPVDWMPWNYEKTLRASKKS